MSKVTAGFKPFDSLAESGWTGKTKDRTHSGEFLNSPRSLLAGIKSGDLSLYTLGRSPDFYEQV